MPRILRNYLISIAIIGGVLLIVHLWDEHFKKPEESSEPLPSVADPVHP